MTENYATPWTQYMANGVQTAFPYPWRIGAAADLQVHLDAILTTAYTVTGVGAAQGGNVVFATAPLDLVVVSIRRITPLTQLTDYIDNDPFGAETHEASLDKLTRIAQDALEIQSRTPALPVPTPNALRNLLFPPPGNGRAIGWNTAGTALTTMQSIASYTFNQGAGSRISFADFLDAGDDMGTVDISAKLQTACELAISSKAALEIPPAAVGYRIDTPINLTDIDGWLLMVGAGQIAPTFGMALVAPVGGSLFLGNTGTGNAVFECLGSNNILFRDLAISSLGQDTPSQVGIVFGTSTTSPALQAPGGANCSLENVCIWLTYNINSVPLYFVAGAGLSHYTNLWTLGDFGVVLTADDALNYTSTYATAGAPIGVDGMHFAGCNLLGYGTQAVLYIQDSHNMRFDQLYAATIFGGPAYSGQPYAIFINEGWDIKIDVECDYFPSVLLSQGSLRNVHVQGSTFPNLTPLDADIPIVAFFAGTSLHNSSFQVESVTGVLPNYWFTSNGVTPTMQLYLNTDFVFDQSVSTNVFFGNVTDDFGIPFFNLRFNGNADTSVVIGMNILGVPTIAAEKRYFLNGNKVGDA